MPTSTRIPVIALDYAEKDKAVLKELMVDYVTGNIYVVSATDKTKILDVTKSIKDAITGLDAANMTVNITGIGVVNLTTFLNQLNSEVDSTVQIKDPGTDFAYIVRDNTIDNLSLKIFNGNIEMDGYTSATQNAIVQKTPTGLRWMPISELVAGIIATGSGSTSGYSSVDGNVKVVPLVVPSNNKIYLSSAAQKSYNLTGNFANVFLPATADEYSVVKWEVRQIQSDFDLIFEPSIFMARNTDTNLGVTLNGTGIKISIPKWDTATGQQFINKFLFETFDSGNSWLMRIEQYVDPTTAASMM